MAINRQTCICGVTFAFRPHEVSRKSAPIEVEPSDVGNIRINLDGSYAVIPKKERDDYAGQRFLNHFVTCARSSRFKGRGTAGRRG